MMHNRVFTDEKSNNMLRKSKQTQGPKNHELHRIDLQPATGNISSRLNNEAKSKAV